MAVGVNHSGQLSLNHRFCLAGVALGQVLAQNLAAGLQPVPAAAAPVQAAGMKPEDVMATLEKLADLKAKGILTQEEFDAKKSELLKKLV